MKALRWAWRDSSSRARRMADGWMVATTSSASSESRGRPRDGVSLKLCAEQRLGRRGAEQEQRGRLDDVELGPQPRHAGVDLALARLLMDAALAALLELEVLDDVGDVDVGACDPDGLEGLVELAARGSDEDACRRDPRGRPASRRPS